VVGAWQSHRALCQPKGADVAYASFDELLSAADKARTTLGKAVLSR